MSNPTWQDITPLPKSILSYFGNDPDYTAEQIEAAYRLLRQQAAEVEDNPLLCRRADITGAEVLAVLEHEHPDAGLPLCPNCGEPATFTGHAGDFTETHGLDCGPYETWHEEWVTCNKCGAKTDYREIDAAQPKEAA